MSDPSVKTESETVNEENDVPSAPSLAQKNKSDNASEIQDSVKDVKRPKQEEENLASPDAQQAVSTVSNADDDNKNDEEEDPPMLDEEEWREELKSILDEIDHTGEFAAATKIDDLLPPLQPKITVDGLGDGGERLAFPLLPSQAESLRLASEKAPYGKGRDTVLDEAVRKAFQIDAGKVHFEDGDKWDAVLQSIVRKCTSSLGLQESQQNMCKANLYKMLLYEPGGHFKKHRDTEKEPGMFGTLVIQLPSKYEGGALVIQHGSATKTVDRSADSEDSFFATAFFADCEHELRPVTNGWRLCLVYNLVLPTGHSSIPLPTAEALTEQSQRLRMLASQWEGACSEAVQGYVLEHKYTEKNLHFSILKGRDREVAGLLRGARGSDGEPLFVACLLLMQKWEHGGCDDGGGYYRRGRYGYDSDESVGGHHTMDEVYDSSTSANHWVGPDDKNMPQFGLSFDMETCLLLDDGEDVDEIFGESPDREEYEGYTGNAGPSLEYWYYRSALVFWPKSSHLQVASKAGLPFMISYLNVAPDSEVTQVASALVQALEHDRGEAVTSDLLTALLRANDESLMVRAVKKASSIPNDQFGKALIGVMAKMKSILVNDAALKLLAKTASCTGYMMDNALSLSSDFLKHLNAKGALLDVLPAAREIVVNSSLSHSQKLMKSNKAEVVAEIAFESSPTTLKKFIDDVLHHADPSKLGSFLKTFIKIDGASTNQDVRRLYELRSNQLKTIVASGPPKFSWHQSQARFVGSNAASANAFLHSNRQSETFSGYNGIGHARNWANKYFGYAAGKGYSATACPGGRGGNAYVTVTKTKTAFSDSLEQYNSDVADLKLFSSVFGTPALENSSNTITHATTDGAPNHKRSKRETAEQADLQQKAPSTAKVTKRMKSFSLSEGVKNMCTDSENIQSKASVAHC